jgi:hypothetical protein
VAKITKENRNARPQLSREPQEAKDKPVTDLMRGGKLGQTAHGALEMWRFRNEVRYTSSFLSIDGPVHEEPGPNWACDFDKRIVFWRPTSPWPPYDDLTPDEVLFLVGHEAAHLDFTGGWDTPKGWDDEKKLRFCRFVNCVEDIRVERLQGVRFPGFEKMRVPLNSEALLNHRSKSAESYGIPDQVGLSWIALETGEPGIGHPSAMGFAEALWPDVSRMCNADSTAQLADAVRPIFELLDEQMEKELGDQLAQGRTEAGNTGTGILGPFGEGLKPGDADPLKGGGAPFPSKPSDRPTKSPLGRGNRSMAEQEKLDGMSKDAHGRGRKKLKADLTEEREVGHKSAESAKMMGGHQAGNRRGNAASPNTQWDSFARMHRGEISALSRRFRAVLKTNAADSYTDGHRRGRLNSRRAPKAVAGNNHIFRQRKAIGAQDYTFGILTDVSGSMKEYGSSKYPKKCTPALIATVIIAEACERNGLGTFVVPWEFVVREWKPLHVPLREKTGQIGADIMKPDGGTYEAPALLVAVDEFARVRSGHKMLFVISDGETRGKSESKTIAEDLEARGVRVVAIGLGVQPASHYSTRVHVSDPGELIEVLPRFINEMMRKGGQ